MGFWRQNSGTIARALNLAGFWNTNMEVSTFYKEVIYFPEEGTSFAVEARPFDKGPINFDKEATLLCGKVI